MNDMLASGFLHRISLWAFAASSIATFVHNTIYRSRRFQLSGPIGIVVPILAIALLNGFKNLTSTDYLFEDLASIVGQFIVSLLFIAVFGFSTLR